MRFVTQGLLTVLLFVACALSAATAGKDGRQFTVGDSIAMTQIMDPPVALAQFQAVDFNLSPDRQLLAVVTRRGNVESGMNEYSLRLFRESEILNALNSEGEPKIAAHTVAVSFATSSYKHAIERVTWSPDGRNVAFIGRDHGATGQVYSYGLDSQKLSQLTTQSEDIATYSLSWEQQVLVFSAYHVKDWTRRNQHGYTVTSQFPLELGIRDPSEAVPELWHYVANIATGKSRPTGLPPSFTARDFKISPSGRWAVVLGQPDKIPKDWRQYEFIRANDKLTERSPPMSSAGANRESQELVEFDESFRRPAFWINQYYVIDLATGEAKPLLDAPAILTGASVAPIWSDDESSVIIASTYLPLQNDLNKEELEHRRSLLAIVEVDRRTHKVRRIADQFQRTPDGKHALDLMNVERLVDGSVSIRERPRLSNVEVTRRYTRKAGHWTKVREIASTLTSSKGSGRLKLSIAQDMNTSPEIFAADIVSGRGHVITDLNPQLRELTLGTVEPFRWTDRLGRTFDGGLLFPPHYQSGHRYPIVIQTYGFRKEEFLLDGPFGTSTAYAARALANQGLLVLQMPELDTGVSADPTDYEANGENTQFVAGLGGAVEELDARGLIDREKIGLVGFSREGMHVHYAVTFSDIKFAAAVISDSVTATPMSYVLVAAAPRPGMLEWESDRLMGAGLWGEGAALWVQRSPLFHLDRIRTPLRLEKIGIGLPSLWETYAILKRYQRPVELVHIPTDTHRLQTPWGRYTSQQGTVDWFSFWLNDQEDVDPQKKLQYERWRMLRRQQEANERTAQRSSFPVCAAGIHCGE